MVVSVSKGEVLESTVDPCAKCGRRVMTNSVMSTKCGKWVHGRCTKREGVTSTLPNVTFCEGCVETIMVDQCAGATGLKYCETS